MTTLTTSKLEEVKEYYGRTLNGSKDLQTNACCTTESLPAYKKEILKQIDDEITSRFYGCGSPIPLGLKDRTVLDLGCGTGRVRQFPSIGSVLRSLLLRITSMSYFV